MKAAVLYGPKDLRVEDIPKPSPCKGEVLIRVKACGICASDIPRVIEGKTYSYPIILGHEFSGEVVELGEGVEKDWKGRRVAVYPLIRCKKCFWCRTGKYNLCDNYRYLGSRTNGAFAEYVVAPFENIYSFPEEISFEEAALIEPAAVALHGLNQVEIVFPSYVSIYGSGPIGIILAQLVNLRGGKIFLIDLVKEKLSLAKKLSLGACINALEEEPVQRILEETKGNGVELSIDAAGFPETFINCIKGTRKRGKILLIGNPHRDLTLPCDIISQILRYELSIIGSWNSFPFTSLENEWDTVLSFLVERKLILTPLISHKIRLDEAEEIFGRFEEKKEVFMRVIFVFP